MQISLGADSVLVTSAQPTQVTVFIKPQKCVFGDITALSLLICAHQLDQGNWRGGGLRGQDNMKITVENQAAIFGRETSSVASDLVFPD